MGKRLIMKILLLFVILMILLSFGTVQTVAMDTGFPTQEWTGESVNTFFKNIELSYLTEEPKKDAIFCFDVSDEGLVAIGQENSSLQKNICVYSTDGVFQYGYSFKPIGSYLIEWGGEYLNIYFFRGGALISLDAHGNVIEFFDVPHDYEVSKYLNEHLYAQERTVNGTKYELQKDGVIDNVAPYSRLVITTSSGDVTMWYDVSTEANKFSGLKIAAVCGSFALGIISTVITLRHAVKKALDKI